ncbi:MAG: TM2 domain-containing protein [Microcystaceae cyanobacterium]
MTLDSAKKKLVKGCLVLAQAEDDPDLLSVALTKIHAALEEACRFWLSVPCVAQQHQLDMQNRTLVSWQTLLELMPQYYSWNVEDVEYVRHFHNLYEQATENESFPGSPNELWYTTKHESGAFQTPDSPLPIPYFQVRRKEIEDYATYVECLLNQEQILTLKQRKWKSPSLTPEITPPKTRQANLVIAYVLWGIGFLQFFGLFGFCGLHRFYLGRPVTGLMWLFSYGFLFLGQFLDLFLIPKMIEEFNNKSQQSLPSQPSLPRAEIGQQVLNKLDKLDRILQQKLFQPEKRYPSKMHKLLEAAVANGKVLSIGQAVIATGLQPDEVQQLLNESIRTEIAYIGNDPETGAVRYYFDI